jgi:hypothetical protein
MPHSLWSRRGVDGRDKPGHDDKRRRRPPKRATNSYRYKSRIYISDYLNMYSVNF